MSIPLEILKDIKILFNSYLEHECESSFIKIKMILINYPELLELDPGLEQFLDTYNPEELPS